MPAIDGGAGTSCGPDGQPSHAHPQCPAAYTSVAARDP